MREHRKSREGSWVCVSTVDRVKDTWPKGSSTQTCNGENLYIPIDSASGQATSMGWEDSLESRVSARFKCAVMNSELGLNSGKALSEYWEISKEAKQKGFYFSVSGSVRWHNEGKFQDLHTFDDDFTHLEWFQLVLCSFAMCRLAYQCSKTCKTYQHLDLINIRGGILTLIEVQPIPPFLGHFQCFEGTSRTSTHHLKKT